MVDRIIAVPTFGEGGLQSSINPRFGRCESFTFVKLVNNEIASVNVVSNTAAGAMGGAGIQSGQILGNNGATEAIVGQLGPNAFYALNSLNIKIYQMLQQNLTVNEAIKLLIEGKLTPLSNSSVGAHFGMGGGGRGMGGGGRGMGGGGGMGRRQS